jgi:hypothetical protein
MEIDQRTNKLAPCSERITTILRIRASTLAGCAKIISYSIYNLVIVLPAFYEEEMLFVPRTETNFPRLLFCS